MTWLYQIRFRLLLINALAVAVPIVGIGFARFYEREMLHAVEADMIHQGQLVRELLAADPPLAAVRAALVRASRDTRTRIRLVDREGQVVADSQPGAGAGPVADRREIRRALAGRYGAATRAGRDTAFLFSALPVDHASLGAVYVSRSATPVHAAMHRLRRSLTKVLAASLAATLLLTLLLAGTISRPLARLGAIARRIADGDRSVRLALSRRDEIGDLARAIDVMAERLHDRARDTRELAADISHEFKSPLTSMRGAAELLLDGAADDPKARDRFLRNIAEDADRLSRLVNRLLELSRAISDELPDEDVDYPALLAEVAPDARIDYRAPVATIAAPAAQLRSVVGNLYDNARAHAAAGTPITIEVDLDRGRLRTRVHNLGRPISPANLPRIWDRFFTTRAGAGGTGLGLPIVRAIVTGRGGDVGVDSDAAAGTTFWFTIVVGPV